MEPLEPLRKKIVYLRKINNISQKELSRLSGVSQSLISKFEEGLVVPRYDSIYKLYSSLTSFEKDETVEMILKSKVKYVTPDDIIKKCKKIIKKHGFSQLPVKKNDNFVGTVESRDLIDVKDEVLVKDIMKEPYDILSYKTPIKIIKEILKNGKNAVLIKKKKEYYIVTFEDII